MFGDTVQTKAQYDQIAAMVAEAEAEGHTVDGFLFGNNLTKVGERGTVRAVLVIDDEPQSRTKWDRVFGYEGEVLATGPEVEARFEEVMREAAEHLAEQLGIDLSGLADAQLVA